MNRQLYRTGALLLLGTSALAGFLELFSSFRDYDDEGVMMLSNRLFLAGNTPFVEMDWLYGPLQLAWVQLVHGVLGVPVTHSGVRFLTLFIWLSLAALSGYLVARLTGSRTWALVAFVLAFLYTGSIVNEPGHPQGLIALAVLSIPLAACLPADRPHWLSWSLAGGLAALVLHIKPNAGAFSAAAVLVVLAGQLRPDRYLRLLRLCLVSGSFAFPFALMLPLLSDRDCLAFALLSGFGAAAVAITSLSIRIPVLHIERALGAFICGSAVVTALAWVYALYLGITPPDVISHLAAYAGQQAEFYHFFRQYSLVQVGLGLAACLVAAAVQTDTLASAQRYLLGGARAAFVLAATYGFAVDDPAHAHALLGWAGPWCWLVAYGRPGRGVSASRLLLAATAAWSPLLAYPVPGSQLYFGTLPLLLAATVCAADLYDGMSARSAQRVPWQRRTVRVVPCAALLACLVVLAGHLGASLQHFRSYEPLGLSGTGPLRIEPRRAEHYRALVEAAAPADLLLTTFRFYSLHLWSGVDIQGPGYLSNFPARFSSPEWQARAQAGLAQARHPVVVDRADLRRTERESAIGSWIEDNFEVERRIGPYLLLQPRDDGRGRVGE